jgi:hypothetical protein
MNLLINVELAGSWKIDLTSPFKFKKNLIIKHLCYARIPQTLASWKNGRKGLRNILALFTEVNLFHFSCNVHHDILSMTKHKATVPSQFRKIHFDEGQQKTADLKNI